MTCSRRLDVSSDERTETIR